MRTDCTEFDTGANRTVPPKHADGTSDPHNNRKENITVRLQESGLYLRRGALTVCPYTWNNSRMDKQLLMKCNTGEFYKNCLAFYIFIGQLYGSLFIRTKYV